MSERTCTACGIRPASGSRGVPRCEECRDAKRANTVTRQRKPQAYSRSLCAECGGPVIQSGRGNPRRFCSEQCNKRASNRRQNRRRQPLRDRNPDPRRCLVCGKEFIPKRSDQVYCPGGKGSGWCAQKAYEQRRAAGEPLRQVEQILVCQDCGEEFTAFKSNARWCSRTCKNRNMGRVMSRRRTGDLPRTPYTDREIFERDGWVCSLCGDPVDPTLPRTAPLGATIDHVTPIALGGADEPDNVALAHWKCNHAKRDRLTLI